jgi:hypothetical protein
MEIKDVDAAELVDRNKEFINGALNSKRSDEMLKTELQQLLNRYSRENMSDTPDYILAEFLMGCLTAFEAATQKRDSWYGEQMLLTTNANKIRALKQEVNDGE